MNSSHTDKKKRYFKTLGIFSSRVVKGVDVPQGTQRKVYGVLKSKGFTETPWQYVFAGQLGGLVYETGERNEIHVRFYEDRIFAEYERGRAYLSHFFGPRFNAVKALDAFLSNELTDAETVELQGLVHRSRLTEQEKSYELWQPTTPVPPISTSFSGIFSKSYKFFSFRGTWMNLSFTLFGLLLVASFFVFKSVYIILFLTLLVALLSFILPKPNKNG